MFKILLSDIRPSRATTAGANSSGANTAFGAFALGNNVTGDAGPAIGYAALYRATGGGNIALGDFAGVNVTIGSGNILIGHRGLADDADTIRIGRKLRQSASLLACGASRWASAATSQW